MEGRKKVRRGLGRGLVCNLLALLFQYIFQAKFHSHNAHLGSTVKEVAVNVRQLGVL